MPRTKLLIVISLSVLFLGSFIAPIHCTKGKRPIDDDQSQPSEEWDDSNKIKLLMIFYQTDTGYMGHDKRIKNEWDRMNGMTMPQSARSLYTQALKWIISGEAKRLQAEQGINFKNLERLPKINWTPEMEEKLIKFYHESYPEGRKQSKRMRKLWNKEYPHYRGVEYNYLKEKVAELLNRRREGLGVEKFNLTSEQKIDLLRFYNIALKYKGKQMMRELFIKRYPQFAHTSSDTLRHHVAHFLGRHPEIEEMRFSAADTTHHLSESGEASTSTIKELSLIPPYQGHDLHEGSDQNIVLNQNTSRSHHVFGEPSSSGHHNFPDVGTSHQLPLPGTSGDHSGEDSAQDRTGQRERKSSKGKEPELDLDLHLR